jgi:hypothetical protein
MYDKKTAAKRGQISNCRRDFTVMPTMTYVQDNLKNARKKAVGVFIKWLGFDGNKLGTIIGQLCPTPLFV